MSVLKIINVIVILVLTIASGFADSKGFFFAANMWEKGRLLFPELLKSAASFSTGIILYWIAVKFMKDIGIVTPELQTAGWVVVTVLGVALVSGQFTQWQIIDQIIGLSLVFGFFLLLVRTGG